MCKFISDLKDYFKGELREKYEFDIADIITFYEAVNQNKSNPEIKEMISDCSECNYKFNYKNKYEETNGYVKGHILVELDNLVCYTIILDNYNESVSIVKNNTVCNCKIDRSVEDYECRWKNELKEFKINKIQKEIIQKEKYIEVFNKEIKNMKSELIELESSI